MRKDDVETIREKAIRSWAQQKIVKIKHTGGLVVGVVIRYNCDAVIIDTGFDEQLIRYSDIEDMAIKGGVEIADSSQLAEALEILEEVATYWEAQWKTIMNQELLKRARAFIVKVRSERTP